MRFSTECSLVRKRHSALGLWATAVCSAAALAVFITPNNAEAPSPKSVTRYIVSFDAVVQPNDEWVSNHSLNSRAKFADHAPAQIQWLRRASGNARVLEVYGTFTQTAAVIDQLNNHPDIKTLVHDALVKPAQTDFLSQFKDPLEAALNTPNDPLFGGQWQLQNDAVLSGSIDAINAWTVTQGAADTVIAVIDTGVRPEHPDLVGRLLPGYDFVSELNESLNGDDPFPSDLIFARSNDGDGRDPDPTDPGDGLDEALAARLNEVNVTCDAKDSTWHGTGIASIIAANANDGVGLTGLDWNAMILPVRAVGRCGGHRSDLLDAIRWAAGVEDPALPPNPTPAHIINLSLGMDDLCRALDQTAINDAILAGAIVVAAVGNQGRNTYDHPSSPSQCQHVIGVAAVDESGYLASYSNHGRDADISAPGGTRFPSAFGIDVATNGGRIDESVEQAWKSVSGTSVAAPLVSGTLGLMRSLQPDLNAQRLTELLLESALPFPPQPQTRTGELCDDVICGAGLLNAHQAVITARAFIAAPEDSEDVLFEDPALASAFLDPAAGAENFLGCSISTSYNSALNPTRDPTFALLLLASAAVYYRRVFYRRKFGVSRRKNVS